jgi:hypothetical protein
MVDGSLRVIRLLPTLKLVTNDIAEILLKVALKHQKSKIKSTLLIHPGPKISKVFLISYTVKT